DHAGVHLAVDALPGDALVGDLLGDGGVELAAHAADLDLPVERLFAELLDAFHARHEARKFLELGELIVDGGYRQLDVDVLLYFAHQAILLRHTHFSNASALGRLLIGDDESEGATIGSVTRGSRPRPTGRTARARGRASSRTACRRFRSPRRRAPA